MIQSHNEFIQQVDKILNRYRGYIQKITKIEDIKQQIKKITELETQLIQINIEPKTITTKENAIKYINEITKQQKEKRNTIFSKEQQQKTTEIFNKTYKKNKKEGHEDIYLLYYGDINTEFLDSSLHDRIDIINTEEIDDRMKWNFGIKWQQTHE